MNPGLLSTLLEVVSLIALAMSAVLIFHWRVYGTGNATIRLVELVYLLGGLLLIAGAYMYM